MSRHMLAHTIIMMSTSIWDKMVMSKINGFNTVLIIYFLLLAVNASAETLFTDQGDVFILKNLSADGVVVGTNGGTSGGGGCTYNWNCTNWGDCPLSGKQTRNCINIGTCSSAYNSPEIEQNCTYANTTSPKAEKEDKGLENETGKQNETGKISEKEIGDKNKAFLYFFIILITGFIIFYLNRDYFKKLIKRN
jgi:hypothetical protein